MELNPEQKEHLEILIHNFNEKKKIHERAKILMQLNFVSTQVNHLLKEKNGIRK